jgi:hypothetical protein
LETDVDGEKRNFGYVLVEKERELECIKQLHGYKFYGNTFEKFLSKRSLHICRFRTVDLSVPQIIKTPLQITKPKISDIKRKHSPTKRFRDACALFSAGDWPNAFESFYLALHTETQELAATEGKVIVFNTEIRDFIKDLSLITNDENLFAGYQMAYTFHCLRTFVDMEDYAIEDGAEQVAYTINRLRMIRSDSSPPS